VLAEKIQRSRHPRVFSRVIGKDEPTERLNRHVMKTRSSENPFSGKKTTANSQKAARYGR